MATSLEQYVAQATQAYQPAQTAIQTQLDNLSSQLDTTNEQINRNYARQQASLNRQKNEAAYQASINAAANGAGFGGMADLANRKYYSQQFVPAVTQMRTNQTNDLAQARQASEDQRTNLNAQMANLQAQANQQALAQYYADQEAERNREIQRQQIASQNAYNNYLMQAAKAQQEAANNAVYLSDTPNRFGGYDWTDINGNLLTAAQVAQRAGGDFNNSLYNILNRAANQGDYYSGLVADAINRGYTYAINTTGQKTGNSIWDTLGVIPTSGRTTYLNNGLSY